MTELDAMLKVIIDGQAYLYAVYMSMFEHPGETVVQEVFEAYENEWKKETVELIEELTDGQADN